MSYIIDPEDFAPTFEVSGCFFEHDGKVLFLHRREETHYGNTWCIPAGIVEQGESTLKAVARELKEETGHSVFEEHLRFIKSINVRYPEFDFVYHLFHFLIDGEEPRIALDDLEHKAHKWLTPVEALQLELIPADDYCVKDFYKV